MASLPEFEARLSLTEAEALVLAAAMRYTDEHATARTEDVRQLEIRLLAFIARHWPKEPTP